MSAGKDDKGLAIRRDHLGLKAGVSSKIVARFLGSHLDKSKKWYVRSVKIAAAEPAFAWLQPYYAQLYGWGGNGMRLLWDNVLLRLREEEYRAQAADMFALNVKERKLLGVATEKAPAPKPQRAARTLADYGGA